MQRADGHITCSDRLQQPCQCHGHSSGAYQGAAEPVKLLPHTCFCAMFVSWLQLHVHLLPHHAHINTLALKAS